MILRLLPLVGHNLIRSKRRSILTVLGVAVAIFVFLTLNSAVRGVTSPVREAGADRLLNVREQARSNVLASRLPESSEQKIIDTRGVDTCTGVLMDLVLVGDERVHVFLRGVDPLRYPQVHRFQMDDAQWTIFSQTKNAAIVGQRLLERMGWTVGDEVELRQLKLRTTIVGVIPIQGIDIENHMLIHRSFLQVLRNAEGQISYVLVLPAKDSDPLDVAKAIDSRMALSPVPTKTVSAAMYAEAIVNEFMGFAKYLNFVGVLIVIVTLLGAANGISMGVRERIREIGMLKAIGFAPNLLLVLILLESTALSFIGGLVGVVLSALVIGSKAASLSGLTLTAIQVCYGLLFAVLVGVGGGIVPALCAVRLKTVDALRIVE
jgi:putative ABC transport system permease protein